MLIFDADFFVPDQIWYEKSAPISGLCVIPTGGTRYWKLGAKTVGHEVPEKFWQLNKSIILASALNKYIISQHRGASPFF